MSPRIVTRPIRSIRTLSTHARTLSATADRSNTSRFITITTLICLLALLTGTTLTDTLTILIFAILAAFITRLILRRLSGSSTTNHTPSTISAPADNGVEGSKTLPASRAATPGGSSSLTPAEAARITTALAAHHASVEATKPVPHDWGYVGHTGGTMTAQHLHQSLAEYNAAQEAPDATA